MTKSFTGSGGRAAALAFIAVAWAGIAEAAKAPPPPAAGHFCGKGTPTCADPAFAGAITADSAMVWAHASAQAQVQLRWKNAKKGNWNTVGPVQTSDATGNTAKFAITGLNSAATYTYQIGVTQAGGKINWSGSAWFTTQVADPRKLSFSVLSDFANALETSQALRTATSAQNDFVMFIGDMDHRNPAADKDGTLPPGDPDVLADMRNMHQNMRNPAFAVGADFYNGLIASTDTHSQTPFYYGWDDHDYCQNNVGADCVFRDFAFQAYRENYVWAADSGLNRTPDCEAVNQHVAYGALLDVFLLDARSGRVQSGANPTMLGACQLDWLIKGLKASTATWKFVMSPVPFNMTTKTYDAWGAFPSEHAQILAAIGDSKLKNVIVLSGDIHSGGAYDDGTHSGLPEVSVPHANMPTDWVNTFCQPIYVNSKFDHLNDEPGTWTIGTMTPPNTVPSTTCLSKSWPGKPAQVTTAGPFPLDGVNAPGYVRVELTTTTATVKVFGADGMLRSGVRADGSSAPLSLQFTAGAVAVPH